jgi:YD repeat-containing protein
MTTAGVDASWIEVLADVLSGTGQAIRLTRNELGHPTGVTVRQDDALQLMVLFPRLAEVTLRAVDALTTVP